MPPWLGDRILALGRERGAAITLSGPVAPGLMDDLDPVRSGRDRLPAIRETGEVVGRREINWTILPGPTPAWAELVHPDLEPEAALAKLEEQLLHVLRLDEEDPVAAWRARADRLVAVAADADRARLRRAALRGPGHRHDRRPAAGRVVAGRALQTADGIPHMPNLPTEEVFTSPDPARVDGHVRVLEAARADRRHRRARPATCASRAAAPSSSTRVQRPGDHAHDHPRDEGAARLGEVALVDNEGRIGALDTVFYDTLLDENAASHIALGRAFPFLAADEDTAVADERVRHPHRLHDRLRRAHRHGHHRRRRAGARLVRRRVADLSSR